MAAGSSQAIGTVTKNIKLSGSPTFTVGSGGIIDFYTGDSSGSTGLATYVDAQSPKSYTPSDTNTNTGVTSINGGAISVEADANLGAATSVAINAGTGTFSSSKDITLNGAATINNTNTTNASTLSGNFTNGANLLGNVGSSAALATLTSSIGGTTNFTGTTVTTTGAQTFNQHRYYNN